MCIFGILWQMQTVGSRELMGAWLPGAPAGLCPGPAGDSNCPPDPSCREQSAWFPGHLSLGFDRDRAGQIEDWG